MVLEISNNLFCLSQLNSKFVYLFTAPLLLFFLAVLQKFSKLLIHLVIRQWVQTGQVMLQQNKIRKMENKKRVEQLSLVDDPHKVKVLILTDQKTIYSDFYFISRFINIVKLDLSYNKLSAFPIGFSFKTFTQMKTLFLHYNKFGSIKSVQIVGESQCLEYLTLFGNPLEETKTRHYFLNRVPTLKLMDDKIAQMQQRNPELILNNQTEIVKLSFPIVTILESDGSTSFLLAVIAQLRLLRAKYLAANPIVKLQRWYRHVLKKRMLRNRSKNIMKEIPIQLETEPKQKVKTPSKERLITEKFEVHVSQQQKLLSLLQMNVEFLSMLREKAEKKVFALRQFCQSNQLKYQNTSNKLLCLRIPLTLEQNLGKNHLQLIIKSSQKYLVRRKGSDQAMKLRNKYSNALGMLLKKRRKRQPNYFKQIASQQDQKLSEKINKIYSNYGDRLVQITEPPARIFQCMKQHWYKCLRQKKLFPFCLQEIMERSAAAVSIQRIWRGYVVRKSLMNSYERICRKHAAWLIQKNVRNLGFYKRNKMLIQITDYLKKEGGQEILVPMDQIKQLQTRVNIIQAGVNFSLPHQKINYEIYPETNQIHLSSLACLSNVYKKYVDLPTMELRHQKIGNALDILFMGAKAVKYFCLEKQVPKEPAKLKNNKSTSTLGQSNVVVIGSPKIQNDQDHHKKQNKLQNAHHIKNFVIFEYDSAKEALNRKFILALLTYKILNGSFIKSLQVNLKQNFKGESLKNINQRVNECFVISKFSEDDTNKRSFKTEQELQKRSPAPPVKLKFFTQQDDHSIKIQAYFPVVPKKLKTEQSLTLPLRQLSYATSIINTEKQTTGEQAQPMKTAHITRNVLTLYPNDGSSRNSQANFMSYREHDTKAEGKYKNRYDDIQATHRQRYLQKSSSLQPFAKNQSNAKGLSTIFNKNLSKSYATEIYAESMTQNVRDKPNFYNDAYGYTSIQDQSQLKKKNIYKINDFHRERIAENNRYRKEELNKIRMQIQDKEEENNKIIQSSRLEITLANARRHNMVKRSLNQKLQQIKKFQKDFMKRGNSSIRKDLIKFQHDRSSKSPDNQSIYQSLKALESEALKNNLIKRPKNVFNLHTEIKQFSIDGSDGDPDLSLGPHQIQSRSKVLHRKIFEQKSEANEINTRAERQIAKRAKSQKKEIKRKKLVHSVFPEQLYPLKQSKRGFELPRIKK